MLNELTLDLCRGSDTLRRVRFKVHRRRMVKIGRLLTSDVHISDREASRLHAAIDLSTTGAVLMDMGSLAGSILNGHPVQKAKLCHGDRLKIGQTTLRVGLVAAPDAPMIATPASDPPDDDGFTDDDGFADAVQSLDLSAVPAPVAAPIGACSSEPFSTAFASAGIAAAPDGARSGVLAPSTARVDGGASASTIKLSSDALLELTSSLARLAQQAAALQRVAVAGEHTSPTLAPLAKPLEWTIESPTPPARQHVVWSAPSLVAAAGQPRVQEKYDTVRLIADLRAQRRRRLTRVGVAVGVLLVALATFAALDRPRFADMAAGLQTSVAPSSALAAATPEPVPVAAMAAIDPQTVAEATKAGEVSSTPRVTSYSAADYFNYEVRPGDTLGSIAQRLLGDEGDAGRIFGANRDVLENPASIEVGQLLRIPRDPTPAPEPETP